MKARVIWTKGPSELADQWAELTRETLIPTARGQAGYEGYVAIYDAESGVAMAITLWADEETERASDEAARPMREQIAAATGTELRVDRYEVAAAELAR